MHSFSVYRSPTTAVPVLSTAVRSGPTAPAFPGVRQTGWLIPRLTALMNKAQAAGPKRVADLGFYRIRLSESNRRPISLRGAPRSSAKMRLLAFVQVSQSRPSFWYSPVSCRAAGIRSSITFAPLTALVSQGGGITA